MQWLVSIYAYYFMRFSVQLARMMISSYQQLAQLKSKQAEPRRDASPERSHA